MGLDGVELVMAIEESFGITLEDDEVEAILTPGDLINVVLRKVSVTAASACLAQRSFHRVRASLMRQLALPRATIVPSAAVTTLIPADRRVEVLGVMSEAFAIKRTPPLGRPKPVTNTIGWFSVAGGILMTVFLLTRDLNHSVAAILAGVATVCVLIFAGLLVTMRFRHELLLPDSTVGGLAKWFMLRSSAIAAPASPSPTYTREQVSQRVREIVIEQLGCETAYREDARFVQDLGLS